MPERGREVFEAAKGALRKSVRLLPISGNAGGIDGERLELLRTIKHETVFRATSRILNRDLKNVFRM
jgi:hypothetical protein